MASVGSAELQIVPSFSGGYKALSKEYGPISERTGKESGGIFGKGMSGGIAAMATKIFAPLAAAAGGVALGGWLKGAVDQASDLNEAGTALSAVFGDAVGTIDTFAKGGAGALGQTELAVKNAAQTFGVYGKAAGLASDANAAFSTDLVGLSTDLASFYNADPSEVVEALGAGLRGEAEPLRRFGILLDDATLKAKAMELGIYDGNGSLTQQQKILASQAAIMEQSSIAQGDFAKTSAGLANQQRILSATWTNFAGVVGTVFLPYVTQAVTALNNLAGPVLDRLAGGLEKGVGWLDGWLDGFGNVTSVGDFFTTFQGVFESAFDALIAWLPTAISTIVPTMVEGIISRYSLIIGAITGVVQAIVGILPTLLPVILNGGISLFMGLISALTTVVPMLIMAVLQLLPPLITTLLGMLPTLVEGALALFMGLVNAVLLVLPQIMTTVLTMLPQVIETLLGMLPTLIDSALTLFIGIVTGLISMIPVLIPQVLALLPVVVKLLIGMIPKLIDAAVTLFTGIVDALPEIIPQLIDAVLGLLPEIVGTLIGMVPDLLQAGVDLIGGLVSGLWQAAGSVGKALLDIGKQALDSVLGFFGIHSPSRVFAGIGENLGLGLVQGIDSMAGDVESSMLAMVGTPPTVAASVTAGSNLASLAAPASSGGDTFVFDGITLGADVPPEVVAWLKSVAQRARAQRGTVMA